MTVDEKGLADEIEREMMTWRGAGMEPGRTIDGSLAPTPSSDPQRTV